MTETRERYILSYSVPWTIASPPPRHFHHDYCAVHAFGQHTDGVCDRCVTRAMRAELELEPSARCPYCHNDECSH
jgi:hypothetical protein